MPDLEAENQRLRDLLKKAQQQRNQLIEKNKELLSELEPYQKMEDDFHDLILATPGASAADKIRQLLKQVAEARKRNLLQQAVQLERQVKQLEQELQLARGQTRNREERVAALIGGGRDKKPCWTDANGKVRYIFDVALTNGGIELRQDEAAERVDEARTLPLGGIQFGRQLSEESFSAETKPLFDWSNHNDCRFYVRVCDLTGPDEKDLYKRLLRTVEGRFYQSPRSECDAWLPPGETSANTRQ